MSLPLFTEFAARAGLAATASVQEVVNAVQAIPYGRPGSRTPDGVIGDWKGTCSTKHTLLARLIGERWPCLCPRLVHRVYRVDRAAALQRYGPAVASSVPEDGLADVHRYLVITMDSRDVIIDVTFPADRPWDGRGSMPLACGQGRDFPAGDHPDADKASLEARHCDPRVREPFIAALSQPSSVQRRERACRTR